VAKLLPDPPVPLILRYFADRKSACVYIEGKRRLLGPWPEHPNPPSQAVQAAFRRIADRWQRGIPIDAPDAADVTVAMLVDRVLTWADSHYRRTNEAVNLKCAARDLLALFADRLAAEFTPMDLEQLQGFFVRKGHTRSGTNKRLGLIRRIFARGVAMGLVNAHILTGLKTISPVRAGDAPESGTRGAVDDETIAATLEHLPPVLQGLIRFQRLTGCRPGEACQVSMGEITRESANLWVYRPAKHKAAHRGKHREVFLGPKTIGVLSPWLRADGLPLFSPKLSARFPDCPKKSRALGDAFRVSSYAHAIQKACRKAGVPVWSPNQLRKARGQEVRNALGLEASAAALGHSLDVSQKFYTDAQEQARRAAIDCG
jgi:integrase